MTKCPKCGNELGENSRFCDQCGAGTDSGTVAAGAAANGTESKGRRNNGLGLIIVLAIIIGAWWILFSPKGDDQTTVATVPGGGNTTAANPHGGGMSSGDMGGSGMANPHGGSMSDSGMGAEGMSNPHGGDMGGTTGGDGMGNLTETLDAARAALAENPLDVTALQTLYQSFGIIGRGGQLRSYLDDALVALSDQKSAEDDDVVQSGKDIAVIAMLVGGDYDGAILVLEGMAEIWPENHELKSMIPQHHVNPPAMQMECIRSTLSRLPIDEPCLSLAAAAFRVLNPFRISSAIIKWQT